MEEQVLQGLFLRCHHSNSSAESGLNDGQGWMFRGGPGDVMRGTAEAQLAFGSGLCGRRNPLEQNLTTAERGAYIVAGLGLAAAGVKPRPNPLLNVIAL